MSFHGRLHRWLVRSLDPRGGPDQIIGDRADPYLFRWYLIPRNRVFNLYLHQFRRSDDDRALHDHPWWNISFLLDGSYTEHTIAAGGESGPDARPMHPDWARSLRDQCAAAGVPFLFKQWGEWAPDAGPTADGRDRIMEGAAPCGVWHGDRWTYARNGYEPKSGAGIGEWLYHVGKKAAGRMLDGVLHDDYPRGHS